ncbi:hypothetical protein D1B33_09785 [Lysinibacillus yapensis]|uniref:Uncharacterized protein n=2 Tax=Ureibacillus yapensis TaxID=2304605 RepID=A0A396S746_9BACL|nr:hypothetical protein D1B33_09785 [Lysinibacillus yapensis]
MNIKVGFENGELKVGLSTLPSEEGLSKEKIFYVYEWFICKTGDIFYVGKGKGDRYKSKDRGIEC